MQRSYAGWWLGASLAVLVGIAPRAIAAEQVVLQYQIIRVPVSVDELSTLAETGESSSTLRRYLRLAGRDSEDVRDKLTREVDVNPQLVDQMLNNPLGEAMLDEMTDVVHTRSRRGDRQALRAAITLSAQDDGRLSMIEVLQNYPTDEVYVDGDRLVDAYNQLASVQERLGDLLGGMGGILQRLPGL